MSDDSHCLIHSCLIEENSEVVEPCLCQFWLPLLCPQVGLYDL